MGFSNICGTGYLLYFPIRGDRSCGMVYMAHVGGALFGPLTARPFEGPPGVLAQVIVGGNDRDF
jgi:hypothetical protein